MLNTKVPPVVWSKHSVLPLNRCVAPAETIYEPGSTAPHTVETTDRTGPSWCAMCPAMRPSVRGCHRPRTDCQGCLRSFCALGCGDEGAMGRLKHRTDSPDDGAGDKKGYRVRPSTGFCIYFIAAIHRYFGRWRFRGETSTTGTDPRVMRVGPLGPKKADRYDHQDGDQETRVREDGRSSGSFPPSVRSFAAAALSSQSLNVRISKSNPANANYQFLRMRQWTG